MMVRRDQHRNGITMIEIMVAVAIIALALLPLLRLISGNYTATARTSNQSQAAAILNRLIEEVKHVPFTTYVKECPDVMQDKKLAIPEKYYPETISALNEQKKTGDREFWVETSMTGTKNESNQLVEIYFEAEIRWRDRGGKSTVNQPERRLRATALVFNPETKFL
ncbi:prepilin-type N-terminal cleavage/methylation domain-containing protein [Candidatus Ozemobacteraceae bacterium]|nr:prepilin-type N-terminal cleavage/methylation domain-containing protein [Candidatus Ozemobacteraceae bacterium]